MKSIKKVGNISSHGGTRKGAGRPATGHTKEKISVSVDKETLAKALKKWKGKMSALVESLLHDYVK